MALEKDIVTVESPGVITVHNNIKSVSHYQPIKEALESEISKGNKNLTIELENSFSITSSVIGVFIKTKSLDGVNLNLRVKDERAYMILEKLKLIELLGVERY